MGDFSFEIVARDKGSRARAGVIKTRHGEIETPYLVPVGTCGTVRGVDPKLLEGMGGQCMLANTYHLHFQPGDELIKKMGGLGKFINWNKPIFTDSGGFQAFSLGLGAVHGSRKIGYFPEEREVKDSGKKEGKERLAKVNDSGIVFQSSYDMSYELMTPKKSMEIQSNLGADIIMAFDECTSQRSEKEYIRKAMERTHRWAIQSLEHHDKNQALYGIIQGGSFKDLRKESTDFIKSQGFDGIAVGGSLGEGKKEMNELLGCIMECLGEDNRPRHMLGIGWVDDLFECIERGMDTFDCVQMTRIARHGNLYVSPPEGNLKNKFKIKISKTKYEEDKGPIDGICRCYTCLNYSRAYLNHLYKAKELSYHGLASIHNIHFILDLVKQIRESIINGNFSELKRKWLG